MSDLPLISICIPAYKRLNYLQRLFISIEHQTFKNFEVIVTDDSPDENVENFVKSYSNVFNVSYYKNIKTLGTPENWNEGIRNAKGTWIKLMHDDDWFANENALQIFYEATLKNPECSFIFSGYNNISETKDFKETILLKWAGRILLKWSSLNLFKKQYIGNPSCTLIKKDIDLFYDNRFQWVVDFEFYIRCLKKVKKYYYINKPLINVGINEEQVTNYTFRKPEVEIPENHLMIDKMGIRILRNIFVYDYYWRLYRNLEIKNENDIARFYNKSIHPLLKQMIYCQKKIPSQILKIGVFSKLIMSGNYLISLFRKI